MKAADELAKHVGVKPACAALEVCRSTLYRRRSPSTGQRQPRPTPARALSETERGEVFDTLCSERFVDRSPAEVVATLLDEEVYLCSERKGRNEVIGDLEALRADIEDFRFPMSPNGARSRKGESTKYPLVRWSLTVTVGVAERGEEGGGWSSRYGAIARAARGALHRGRKAGGNTVSK